MNTARQISTKVQRSIELRGFVGTLGASCSAMRDAARGVMPAARAARQQAIERDLAFDRVHGVSTSGVVRPEDAGVVGDNWIHGIKYEAIDPERFNRVLSGLSIPFEEFEFVDFGSGKGRAVLLASGFAFKRVTGVEYATDLDRIARDNVAKFPDHAKACNDIELVCADAAEYQLPDAPLVLFFFNPFGPAVMERVVQRVVASHEANPRRMVVVYLTPQFAGLWDAAGFLERASDGRPVWETRETAKD